MLFEAHITVDSEDLVGWTLLCEDLEIKPLYIELSQGEHRLQLMCAAVTDTDLEGARRWIDELRYQIAGAFDPIRTKLECPLDKAHGLEIPHTTAYSECHMKLMLPVTKRKYVNKACQHAEVVASRNLLAVSEGLEKWYLTKRVYGEHTIESAADQFNGALTLANQIFSPVRMEMERVLLDTNPGLDYGWA